MLNHRRWLAALLVVLAALTLFSYAATRPIPSNSAGYVTLFEAISVAMLCWLTAGVARYCASGEKMKIHTYRITSIAIRIGGILGSLSLMLSGVLTLLHGLLNGTAAVGTLLPAVALLAAGACALWLWRRESGVEYRQEPAGHTFSERDVFIK